jgi:hypothetical protein
VSTKEALQDKRIQEVIEGNGRGSVTAYAKWESGRVTKQVIGVAEGVVDKAPFIFSPVDVKPEDLQGKHIDWEKVIAHPRRGTVNLLKKR